MQITQIEVIRSGRPLPKVVGAIVGEEVEVSIFDTLRVYVSFDYRGIAQPATLYGAVGSRLPVVGFVEHCPGEAPIDLPATDDSFLPQIASVDIPMRPIASGVYDLYVKIKEYPEAGMPEVEAVIILSENYQEVQHTIYPWGYIYDGEVETCVFDFKLSPEQVPGTAWLGQKVADTFAAELEQDGAKPIELKIFRDIIPTFWTNYRVEITADVSGEKGVAGVANPFPWGAVIVLALAILFIVAITWAIKTIDKLFFNRSPGLHEIKPLWSRETLVGTIHDTEEYLEKPLTPNDELEGMSEAQLRVYLDDLAEEVVPPGIDWGWAAIALAGGLGIAGVAAAVAFSRRE